ncbi:hypothetical protein D3C81_2280550 [compost metagenome]
MTIAAGVYRISSGLSTIPRLINVLFSSPLRPRMTIQLKERTTGLVSSGKIAKASRIPLRRGAFCEI